MRGQRSGSGEPSALSGQVTLNDPEIGRPRLPEEEHSITAKCVRVCVCLRGQLVMMHRSVTIEQNTSVALSISLFH